MGRGVHTRVGRGVHTRVSQWSYEEDRGEWELVLTQVRGLVCQTAIPNSPLTDLSHSGWKGTMQP